MQMTGMPGRRGGGGGGDEWNCTSAELNWRSKFLSLIDDTDTSWWNSKFWELG